MTLILEVKVTPSSGRQGFSVDKSGTLKCYLKSPPEQGKANQELIKVLAKRLNLSMGYITILSGHTQRKKRLKIETPLTFEGVLDMLGIDRQRNLF